MALRLITRAGDRTRTGDPQLGKLMLYQLSYARVIRQSTGQGGEIKRARDSSGPKNERGTGPFRAGPPRSPLAPSPGREPTGSAQCTCIRPPAGPR